MNSIIRELWEVAALPFQEAQGEIIEGRIANKADEPPKERRVHGAYSIAERRQFDDVAQREQQRIDEQNELEGSPEQRCVEQHAPRQTRADAAHELKQGAGEVGDVN